MRIVIADAHRVFAEALTSLLRRAGHEIVGFATALDAAAAIIEREQVDACVMDIGLPGAELPGAVARVTARAPRTAFVVLAESADVHGLAGVLGAGVRGLALKSDEFVEILRVLTGATSSRASSRGTVLSMAAQTGVLPRRRGRTADDRAQFLTQREWEALARLVRGESTTAIARAMGVRVSTARSHVDAVLTKLGAHSRLEAVAYAVRERLVDVDWRAEAGDRDSDTSRAIAD
jgi:two-component system, NarL family, nitrate/nitrite response regulator NarL